MTDVRNSKSTKTDSSYVECMTRSLFAGLAVFSLGFSCTYFAQKLIRSKFPYSQKASILVSSVLAIGSSYKVTSYRINDCNEKSRA